jgi:tRNA pseudouridine38-40 synthase
MVFTTATTEIEKMSSLATANKIALVMEYDGTNYYGFQLQSDRPTIQAEIEKALWRLTGEQMRVMASGRTDAGVHAKGQVVSFRTGSRLSPQTFVNGLNYYLPEDIAVKAAYGVADSFNVRRGAVSREYRYHIINSSTRSPIREGFSYRVPGCLDIESMNGACQALVGEHDFASFVSNIGGGEKSTVRIVYQAGVEKSGDLIVLSIVANAFLRHQVRSTAGALVRVGLGKMSVDEFQEIMGARKPGLAGPILPARGLCLMQVNYPRPFEEQLR